MRYQYHDLSLSQAPSSGTVQESTGKWPQDFKGHNLFLETGRHPLKLAIWKETISRQFLTGTKAIKC